VNDKKRRQQFHLFPVCFFSIAHFVIAKAFVWGAKLKKDHDLTI